MNNVHRLRPEQAQRALDNVAQHGGPQPPDNGGMDTRISKLEAIAEKTSERLVAIEKDVAVIKFQIEAVSKNYATNDGMKAAISEAKNSIIMWVVSAIFLAQLLPTLLKKFGL